MNSVIIFRILRILASQNRFQLLYDEIFNIKKLKKYKTYNLRLILKSKIINLSLFYYSELHIPQWEKLCEINFLVYFIELLEGSCRQFCHLPGFYCWTWFLSNHPLYLSTCKLYIRCLEKQGKNTQKAMHKTKLFIHVYLKYVMACKEILKNIKIVDK